MPGAFAVLAGGFVTVAGWLAPGAGAGFAPGSGGVLRERGRAGQRRDRDGRNQMLYA